MGHYLLSPGGGVQFVTSLPAQGTQGVTYVNTQTGTVSYYQAGVGYYTVGANPPSSYDAAVLQDAPASYWEFLETSGITSADSGGSGNTLTWDSATPPRIAGPGTTSGQAIQDTGGGLHAVTSGAPANLQLQSGFSLDILVNAENISGSIAALISSASGAGFSLFLDANGLIRFNSGAGGLVTASAAGMVTGPGWHHVAATLTNALVTHLYLDGQDVTGPGAITAVAAPGQIGIMYGAETGIAVHKPAIYPNVLTLARVQAHFQAIQ
jgi:hypothetical protein